MQISTFSKICSEVLFVAHLSKKPSLDPTFKNCHPVSNLSFLSKLIENPVSLELEVHNLSETLQFTYKELHSTETALLIILKVEPHVADMPQAYHADTNGIIRT